MKLIEKIGKKNALIYLGIMIIAVLLALVARVTFAWFVPSRVGLKEEDLLITGEAGDIDVLRFKVGEPLNLVINSETLSINGENISISTNATATLVANNTTNIAESSYYLYFKVKDNNFIYSRNNMPEIILTIIDPDGNEVTDIADLDYGTFGGVSGFDITTLNDTILVADNYKITVLEDNDTTHEWQFILTYLNYNFDQAKNYGNTMTTEVIIQKNALSEVEAESEE